MKVALDWGHLGKGTGDEGARADLDGDGVVEAHETEGRHIPDYLLPSMWRLIDLGHDVRIIADGDYGARQARGIAYGVDVYVACHLNAGGGDYGLAVHNPGSASGLALAKAVTAKLTALCPELRRVVVGEAREGSFPRAANCIGGLAKARPVGLVYEPWFIDTPAHAKLAATAAAIRVGHALAEGIHAWGAGR